MVEILVALAIAGIVGAAAMTLSLSSRELFEQDQRRTAVNQNLRAGMDLLGIDLRQAGERMPGDAPAIEIQNGTGGASDTLILRRNLLAYVMPLCKNITAGSSADSVFVAKLKVTGFVPPGCAPVPDSNGDGWPDNLEVWRDYRIANGGSVLAYIHNPVTAQGEFFVYDDEDNSTFHLHKANGENWQYDYLMNQEPRIYIIEQRSYQRTGDLLQVVINSDTSNPLHLVNRIRDFQVVARFDDGTTTTTLTSATDWTSLESLEVELVAGDEFGLRDLERTMVMRFFPRNVLSN